MSSASGRALLRDVFFSDFRDPATILGGLVLTSSVTKADFHQMIGIVLITNGPFSIQTENGDELDNNLEPLERGHYLVVADDPVVVTDEIYLTRAMSITTGTRVKSFRDAVRARDGRCVVTKVVNPLAPNFWLSFEAAHIFPFAHEVYWNAQNYGRWITLVPERGGAINSVQNGLLLSSNLHGLFDNYFFSINPDVSWFLSLSYHNTQLTSQLRRDTRPSASNRIFST